MNNKVKKLQAKVVATKKELADTERAAKEADALKQKLEILKKKLETIETLQKDRRAPIELMTSLSDVVVPKRMWFTSVRVSGDNLSMDGYALDNNTVANFMTRLKESKMYVRSYPRKKQFESFMSWQNVFMQKTKRKETDNYELCQIQTSFDFVY